MPSRAMSVKSFKASSSKNPGCIIPLYESFQNHFARGFGKLWNRGIVVKTGHDIQGFVLRIAAKIAAKIGALNG